MHAILGLYVHGEPHSKLGSSAHVDVNIRTYLVLRSMTLGGHSGGVGGRGLAKARDEGLPGIPTSAFPLSPLLRGKESLQGLNLWGTSHKALFTLSKILVFSQS